MQANRGPSEQEGKAVGFFYVQLLLRTRQFMSATSTNTISQEERDQLRQTVEQASEPIAPFWPMRTMVAQNPIHG